MSTRLIGFLALLLVGSGFAVQAVINARLSKYIGVVEATLISVSGTWVLITILFLTRLGSTRIGEITTAPPYLYIGGIFGLVALLSTIILVPILGTGSVFVTLIGGQLLAGILFDHFGVLGMPRVPIDLFRVAGAILVVAGVKLVFR